LTVSGFMTWFVESVRLDAQPIWTVLILTKLF